MKKILVAYENRQHPVEMDISERSELQVKKIEQILRKLGRTWETKTIEEPK